jgi:putative ABC transport system permease protein
MPHLMQDLKYAWRMLLSNPGFTFVALFALILGIGASTAIFSVVNAVLLRPLPFHDPGRLVMVWTDFPNANLFQIGLSEPEFFDVRNQRRLFQAVAAVQSTKVNLTGIAEPERLPILYTSASFFPVLGASPIRGRAYTAEEDFPGRNDVVVLSFELSHRLFGGPDNVIGKKLLLDDRSTTVVGVMPPGFHLGDYAAELWAPIALDPGKIGDRSQHYLRALARLAPGVTVDQARSAMKSLARQLTEEYPQAYINDAWNLKLVGLQNQIVGDIRPALLVLLGAVGFVLLIACVNVANLLLARAAAREREIGIRSALGASRQRLFRQLMTESVVLALLGGVGGLLLAYAATQVLVVIGRGQIPRLGELSVDWRVLTFTLGASLVTGIVFGLMPALQANRPSFSATLREGSPTGQLGRSRLRGGLVVAELAIALMLLIGASLLIKSFIGLRQLNPGFNPKNVLSLQLLLPKTRYPEEAQQTAFFRRAIAEIHSLPSVISVGAVSQLPFSDDYWSSAVLVRGKVLDTATGHPSAEIDWRSVSPGYFETMQIPLERGRTFLPADDEKAQQVAIVDEAMARRAWPNEDPLGKQVQEASFDKVNPWLTVVGVVGKVKHYGLTSEGRELVYRPQLQRAAPFRAMTLVVRSALPPESLLQSIRAKLRALDPDQPLSRVTTMNELVAASIAKQRFYLFVLSAFSVVALVLASVGIYGLVAFSAAQRTHELGIRMALGADRDDVLKLIVGQGLALTLIGLPVGLIAGYAGSRVMSSLLYGVSAGDPFVYLTVTLVLGSVALIASYLPARRATRLDPLIALRQQ